jgi:Zn-dependent oligopeptidase
MHMSATRKWAETSGRTGLEWDALNLMPDLMTHWLTVPHVLASLSSHWSTGSASILAHWLTVPHVLTSLSSHWSTGIASLLADGIVNPCQPLFSLVHR